MSNYIVAGGGLAGLTAAIELASNGKSVTLYEQAKNLGGRAATHSQQGFAINIGPHGFYRAGLMKGQLDAWEIPYSGRPPLGSGKAYLIAAGKTHAFPGNAAGLLRCGALTLSDKLRAGQLLAQLPRAVARPGESMETWINRQSTSVNVRNLLAALTRLSTYAASLADLDAQAALSQVQLALKASVLYLDGGWQSIVNGLAAKARALGVTIRTGVAITPSDLQADGIVLAIPPRAVEQLTGRRLPEMIPARAACLDLGLRNLPEKAGTFALGLDEATYVSVHSEYAAGLAPEGGALVQLAKYLNTGETCTRDELEQRADLVLPGWRNELAYSRFLPEMTVVHAIPGVSHPRPDVDALNLANVVIAGDWAGPEAMLADAAVASGVRAARRLLQDAAVIGHAAA